METTMSKIRNSGSRSQRIKANMLYHQAEENWRRGQLKHAFRHFLAAAKAGMTSAYGTVGQFYDQGDGVKTNPDAALFWYLRAYRSGDYSVANNIGCILRDKHKLSQALRWFHQAVKRGDADANLEIAKIYLSCKHNAPNAIRYLKRVLADRTVTEGSKEEAERLLNN
jgi:TPR repeat protein